MTQRSVRRGVLWGTGFVVLGLLLAPIWILWCPGAGAWRAHAYRTLMYGQLARRITQDCRSTEQTIDRLAEYIQTHVWPAVDVSPYTATPFDYLVKGIGWCDYQAMVFIRLLATCRIPARYAMLVDNAGISPHTIAEVFSRRQWGAYDILFGIRFTDPQGDRLTLEALSKSPDLLNAQPMVVLLREQAPDMAAHVQEVYARVMPMPAPPRRSSAGTQRLTVFDRALLWGSEWVGRPFVEWYQDRYLASAGLNHPSTTAERLQLARHWHLAGRTALAKRAYLQCLTDKSDPALAHEVLFWLGVLQWELERDAAGALETFHTLVAQEAPRARWMPMAWYYMGRCEETLNQPEQAQACYAQANKEGLTAACPYLVHVASPSSSQLAAVR